MLLNFCQISVSYRQVSYKDKTCIYNCDKYIDKKNSICKANLLTYKFGGPIPLAGGVARKAGEQRPPVSVPKKALLIMGC